MDLSNSALWGLNKNILPEALYRVTRSKHLMNSS